MARITLIAILSAASTAHAGHCGQFFYKKQAVVQVVQQQVVYPAVAVSPYIYQAGRDIEADALAAKVAKLVVPLIAQQLRAQSLTQETSATVMGQKCAKCHSGAAPKAGQIFDGSTKLLCHQVTDAIRAVRDDKMPKGGPALTPEQKGALLEELLQLENDADRPRVTAPPPPPPELP